MKRRRQVRLEMTALMDVMFLVMVFFIYAIFEMAVHKGLKVDLPAGEGTLEKGRQLVVTIRADDTLELDGVALLRTELVAAVRRRQGEDGELPVLIAGDRHAALGTGIGLLSDLRAAGVEKASFQVTGER